MRQGEKVIGSTNRQKTANQTSLFVSWLRIRTQFFSSSFRKANSLWKKCKIIFELKLFFLLGRNRQLTKLLRLSWTLSGISWFVCVSHPVFLVTEWVYLLDSPTFCCECHLKINKAFVVYQKKDFSNFNSSRLTHCEGKTEFCFMLGSGSNLDDCHSRSRADVPLPKCWIQKLKICLTWREREC